MTYYQLRTERRINKIREAVDDEIKSLKRKQEISESIENVISFMTLILLIATVLLAFTIDAFGTNSIPIWVYLLSMGYIGIYSTLIYRKLTK